MDDTKNFLIEGVDIALLETYVLMYWTADAVDTGSYLAEEMHSRIMSLIRPYDKRHPDAEWYQDEDDYLCDAFGEVSNHMKPDAVYTTRACDVIEEQYERQMLERDGKEGLVWMI